MKKTKLWLILLTVVMSASLLVGCGKDSDSDRIAEKLDGMLQSKEEGSNDNDENDESESNATGEESESGDGNVEPSGESDDSSDVETESSEEETTNNSEASDESVRPTGPDTTVDDSDISSSSAEDITTDGSEITTTKKPESTTTKKPETTTTKKPEATTTKKPEATTTKKPETTTTKKPETTTKPSSGNSDTNVNYGAIINKGSEDYLDRYSKRGISSTEIVKAEAILNSILKTSMSEVERVRAIHDWLVKNVNYDYDTANNMSGITGEEAAFSATGALINGLAVCEGYSEAFLLLCWTAGIDAMLVEGTGNGGGHEWNVVKIDGNWYQVDVTWDDPAVNGVLNDPTGSNLRYDYFLITTAKLQKDHVISSCFDKEDSDWKATVPSCTSEAFYEYARKCTFEVKLGSIPYTIISSYNEADSAVTAYSQKGIYTFALIYTENTLDYGQLLQRAANIAKKGGSISVESSIGYSIAIITLS